MDNTWFFIKLINILNEKTSKSNNNQALQKQLKKARKRKAKIEKAAISAQQENKAELIYQIHSTITHHFPELFDWMRDIDDCRKKASKFELSAHLTACLAMFIFKTAA